MKKFVICPKKMGSESATALARFYKRKKVFPNRKYISRSNNLEVNWGNASDIPVFRNNILNKPSAVAISSNKVSTFDILDEHEVNIPYYTTDRNLAKDLFDVANTDKVYCRTLTRASEGRGIVIATNPEELVPAGLYTAKEAHTNEYRVHVFKGKVIDVVEKRRMSEETLAEHGIEAIDEDIRSNDRGWVFVRGNARLFHLDGEPKRDIATQAIKAVEAIGLDFAAVDVIYDNPRRQAFILEVNSAPGMEEGSTTLFNYVNAFNREMGIDEISMEDFNAQYPDKDGISEYEVVTNFINKLDNE